MIIIRKSAFLLDKDDTRAYIFVRRGYIMHTDFHMDCITME